MKGQGMVEYVLMLVLIMIVIVVLLALLFAAPPSACNKSKPTAGDVVDCIATRTAEAHNR